ncbi:MAG: dephospho-CoA kinase, partial [Candidatus Muiribacterium halophilum]
KLASKLMEGDSEILKKIQKTFGEESVVNGMLNRKLLRKKLFSDKKELKKMNDITNKVLREHVAEIIQKMRRINKYSFIVVEAAVLFESGLYRLMDKNIWVDVSIENSVKRVKTRDNNTEKQVRDIYLRQTELENIKGNVDILISNNGSKSELRKTFNKTVLPELMNL